MKRLLVLGAALAALVASFVVAGPAAGGAPAMSFTTTELTLDPSFVLPQAIAVADVDGRNGPDIVLVDQAGDISVFLNDGHGNFTRSTTTTDHPCNVANSLAVGHFSGSGHLDVLVACYNDPAAFVRYRGNGDGTFAPAEGLVLSSAGTTELEALQNGSIDADGGPGVVFEMLLTLGAQQLLCTLTETELAADFTAPGTYPEHCSIEFNPNGPPTDIIQFPPPAVLGTDTFPWPAQIAFTISPDPGFVNGTILALNFGSGRAGSVAGYDSTLYEPLHPQSVGLVAAGDLNHDGVSELIGLDDSTIAVYNLAGYSVLAPGLNGIPDPLVVPSLPTGASRLQDALVGDFNGDGNNDVAVLTDSGDGDHAWIAIHPGDGRGGLGPFQSFPVDAFNGAVTHVMASADFNGDGLADLAVVNTGAGEGSNPVLNVLLNTTSVSVNHAPTCSDGSAKVAGGGTLNGSVACSDPDAGDSATVSQVSGPSHGALTLNPDGTYTYTPNAGFLGDDSFTFQATDTHGAVSNVATESILVYNTPKGASVVVQPAGAVRVTFSGVTNEGVTSATASAAGPALPSGFVADGEYWDVQTTATYTPPVEVCLDAGGAASPRLFHDEGGVLVDVTTRVDPPYVCGNVTSLSPFVAAHAVGTLPAPGTLGYAVDTPSAAGPPYPTSPVVLRACGVLSPGDPCTPVELLGLALQNVCSPSDPCTPAAFELDAAIPPDPIRATPASVPPTPIRQSFDLLVSLGQRPDSTVAPVLVPPTPILPPNPIKAFDVTYLVFLQGVAVTTQTLHFAIAANQPYTFTNVAVSPPHSPRFDVSFTLEPTGGGQQAGALWTVTPSGTIAGPDTTPPVLSVPSGITKEATGPAGAAVSYTAAATDDLDPNPKVACTPASGATFPLGDTTVRCTATDAGGNSTSQSFPVHVVDTTPPTLSLPADLTATAATNSSATVGYTASASDLVDGAVPTRCTPASGSSFPVGTSTVTCTATDAHGNTATGSFHVTVRYSWSGLRAPVNNPPTVNTAKAGSAIPVKFSLSGNQGLAILAAGSPQTQAISCSTLSSDPTDPVETTVTAGGSSLTYNATADQYTYVWKTPSGLAGTCQRLDLKLADGTTHSAYFQFK